MIDANSNMLLIPSIPMKGFSEKKEHSIFSTKRRIYSVGSTNRFRSPCALEGDLLGTSQSHKASKTTCNRHILRHKTADVPKYFLGNENDFLNTPCVYSRFPLQSFSDSSLISLETSAGKKYEGLHDQRQSSGSTVSSLQRYSQGSVSPSVLRFRDPFFLFEMFAAMTNQHYEPDIRLHCMHQVWPLHRPNAMKSKVLQNLIKNDSSKIKHRVYNNETAQRTDRYISQSRAYTPEYKEVSRRLNSKDEETGYKCKKSSAHPVLDIVLKIDDPWISKQALASALGHLYLDEVIMSASDVVEILAAACYLQFNSLISSCCQVMSTTLAPDTVCRYLQASMRYKQQTIVSACERWLQLNLVAYLSCTIYLKDLPIEILQKILTSSHLFTYNEYSLYKTLCFWLFMRLHSGISMMPSQTTIMTYFSSMSRNCSFLERETGIPYTSVFGCLRLHGITNTKHLQDLMYMNIIPQTWLLRIFSHHYQALQGGGDMSFLLNFSLGACRFGFIVEKPLGFHSEIISLHGFHFEVRAQKSKCGNTYSVYVQRLQPTDPSLSFRACERATFSMRHERLVRYKLSVQHSCLTDVSSWECKSTGVLEQTFTVDQDCKSQIHLIVNSVQTTVAKSVDSIYASHSNSRTQTTMQSLLRHLKIREQVIAVFQNFQLQYARFWTWKKFNYLCMFLFLSSFHLLRK